MFIQISPGDGASGLPSDYPSSPDVPPSGKMTYIYPNISRTTARPGYLAAGNKVIAENTEYCFKDEPYLDIVLGETADILLPSEFVVYSGYPNPFNPSITVPFKLPEAGEVEFTLFTLLGQCAFHTEKYYQAGVHDFVLDLKANNHDFSSGIYLLTLGFKDRKYNQKILFLK